MRNRSLAGLLLATALLAAMLLATMCVAACSNTAARAPAASAAARQICGTEASGEIATALGVGTTSKPSPTWVDRLYSCRYVYASGSLVISVKDLADSEAAAAYFDEQHAATAGATELPGVGQAAFAAPDGSAIVRKDAEVMRVDVAALPATFGVPPHPRSIDAITVATVILDCWTET